MTRRQTSPSSAERAQTVVALLGVLAAIAGLAYWGFFSMEGAPKPPRLVATPIPTAVATPVPSAALPSTDAIAPDEKPEPKSSVGPIQLPKSDQAQGKSDSP